MLLGILSDTHDHLDNVKKALELFKERNVDIVVHCGDIISPFCLDFLNQSGLEWLGVLGNNDGEVEILLKRADGRLSKEPKEIELEGKKILIKHYHHFVDEVARSGKYDLILYGHTHQVRVDKLGATLVVNPGECCGWLTKKPTVAIVNLEKMEAEIVEL
ncbi:phosphodiesterase [Thermosulfidibacter takaii ABI70S6]|uniref:Phosphoesterase n=2 Tax=Thermosulfidibacter takaii TaxID=412593 RepID=A0A0S3QW60_THET7|nr:phosphodiesterase [Thermosulfidibacter takaii ABI70S6]